MGAGCLDPSMLQDYDLVGVHDGGYPLGNDDFRASFQITGQPFADAGLCGSVHRAGGIVQDQDLRMLQERPGNAETLFLPPEILTPPWPSSV